MLSMSYAHQSKVTIGLIFVAALSLAACSNNDQPASSSSTNSNNIQTSSSPTESSQNQASADNENTPPQSTDTTDADMPTYVVATDTDFKPFGFRGADAQIIGFDVDVLNAIAADQKFKLTYIVVPLNEQFDGLKQHKFDISAAGLSITDARKNLVSFSQPYFTSRQAIMALPESPKITDFSQLKSYTVAVKPNTTSESILKNNLKLKTNNIILVNSPYNAVEAVVQGRSQYVMGDSPVLQYYGREFKNMNLKLYIDSHYEPEYYGFAFAKNRDDDLIQKINTGLEDIKANGTYKQLTNKWFIN